MRYNVLSEASECFKWSGKETKHNLTQPNLTSQSRLWSEELHSYTVGQDFKYRVHQITPLDLTLLQLNQLLPYFSKIRFNISLPSTPWSPTWSLFLSFPNQIYLHISHFKHKNVTGLDLTSLQAEMSVTKGDRVLLTRRTQGSKSFTRGTGRSIYCMKRAASIQGVAGR
jgi:hypothetical protein